MYGWMLKLLKDNQFAGSRSAFGSLLCKNATYPEIKEKTAETNVRYSAEFVQTSFNTTLAIISPKNM